MTGTRWIEAGIGKSHDRKAFDCGETALNDYLVRFARQNHDSGGAKTFLACDRAQPTRILGFYSLSPASIDYARVPSLGKRGLGRYDVPVFRLGRLAVDQSGHDQGQGGNCWLQPGNGALQRPNLSAV